MKRLGDLFAEHCGTAPAIKPPGMLAAAKPACECSGFDLAQRSDQLVTVHKGGSTSPRSTKLSVTLFKLPLTLREPFPYP